MANWRVAESLQQLLRQLNAAAPKRSKVSDGSIGDAAHASRSSDHNPWFKIAGQPVVTARDFTHDPKNGLDCNKLADALVKSDDRRIKYIIWNRRIWQGKWTPYSGSNPHTSHLHLSVVASAAADSTAVWNLPGLTTTPSPSKPQEDSLATVPQAQWDKVYRQEAITLDYRRHHGSPEDDQLGHTLSIRQELAALRTLVGDLAAKVDALAAKNT